MTLRPLLVATVLGVSCLTLAPNFMLGHSAAAQTTVAPLVADTARIAALSDTLLMGQVMDVMHKEGLAYGQTLEDQMFAGRGGTRWQATVARIYDPDQMRAAFDAALTAELIGAGDDLPQIEAFFESAQGQKFLQLEIDARREMLNAAVEDAAKVSWADMSGDDTARAQQIRRFAAANDLIDQNVTGALNANLAFFRGMAEAGSFPDEMTEQQMLADVAAQEDEIRTETENWLYPLLALAYEPMSDAELDAYIAFSESPAGKRMNTVLFVAFDAVFNDISARIGKAAALQMQGEDI